jgi:hypothetical protein
MIIPIKTDSKKFFRQFIGLLSSFDPIRNLRPREREVLAEIMYQNYRHKSIEDDLRHIVVFSTKNRKVMCENLNLSEDGLNNNLSVLRKAEVLTRENELPKVLNVFPGKVFDLSFKFKVEKDVD